MLSPKPNSMKPSQRIWRGSRGGTIDKETEQIVRAIYEDIKKEWASLDWLWVKQEAEAQLAGKSPSGSVGRSVEDHLKKAGKL